MSSSLSERCSETRMAVSFPVCHSQHLHVSIPVLRRSIQVHLLPVCGRSEDLDSLQNASSRAHEGQQGSFLGSLETCLWVNQKLHVRLSLGKWGSPSVCFLNAEWGAVSLCWPHRLFGRNQRKERGTSVFRSHRDVIPGSGPWFWGRASGPAATCGLRGPGVYTPLLAMPTAHLYIGVLGHPMLTVSKLRSGLGTLSRSKIIPEVI